MATTGELIRAARKKAGLTQKSLGEKCSMPDSQIRQYELGMVEPKLEQLRRIAEALNIPLCELVSDWKAVSYEEIINDWNNKSEKQKIIEFSERGTWAGSGEMSLIFDYRKLNAEGKKEAKKRVQELTEIKKYTDLNQ